MLSRPRSFEIALSFLGLATLSAGIVILSSGPSSVALAATSTANSPAPPASHSAPDAAPSASSNYTMYIYADDLAGAKEEVAQTVENWASCAAQNDVANEVNFYAPRLDRYFLQRNVSREFVKHDKLSLRSRGSEIHDFKVSDLKFVAMSGESATLSFSKSWVLFDGRTALAKAGTTKSRLWLRRTPDGWKITGEQDLKG